MGVNLVAVPGTFKVTANELIARRGEGALDSVDPIMQIMPKLEAMQRQGFGDEPAILEVSLPQNSRLKTLVALEYESDKAMEALAKISAAKLNLPVRRTVSDHCQMLELMFRGESDAIDKHPGVAALFDLERLGWGLSEASVTLATGKIVVHSREGARAYKALMGAHIIQDQRNRGERGAERITYAGDIPVGPDMGLNTRRDLTRAERRRAAKENKGQTGSLIF